MGKKRFFSPVIGGRAATMSHDELTGVLADQHPNTKVGTKVVDESAIADGKGMVYRTVSGNLEYEAQAGGGGGGWTLVSDQTLASDAASITFSGLDMENDGPYALIMFLKSAISGGFDVYLFYNGDETLANYYAQTLHAMHATISAARVNSASICTTTNGIGADTIINLMLMKIPGQYPRLTNLTPRFSSPAAIALAIYFHIRNNTENVTSITIKTSAAGNPLASGSRFVLMRVS